MVDLWLCTSKMLNTLFQNFCIYLHFFQVSFNHRFYHFVLLKICRIFKSFASTENCISHSILEIPASSLNRNQHKCLFFTSHILCNCVTI